jgi:leucyl aminopeptidase (aminopeptidase T)
MSDLDRAVAAVVRDCLGVGQGEEVLVVCNPATHGLGDAMRAEAAGAGAEAVLAVMAERASHAGEPPQTIAEAMASADVVLAPTVQSLSHTAARKRASEAGARIATLPGVTEEMLARVMSADMAELRRRGGEVAQRLDDASEAVITCPNGSDLHLDLEGRVAIPDAGELSGRGAFGNLPCGEGFIPPANGWGTLVIDGSLAGIGLAADPVELVVEAGHLTSARGGQGMEFMELLTVHGEDGTNVAELGIGTNEKAILTGNILEDEKILGTAHVAFGAGGAGRRADRPRG